MRDYAKISPSFWLRGSGKRLRGDAEGQVLALYLVSCPSANMIGVYYVPFVTMAHETGLGEARTRAALERVAAAEFAFYDHDAEIAWVPNMAAYQIGEEMKAGDKRRGAVLAELDRLGAHHFVLRFAERYGDSWRLAIPDELTQAPPKDLPSYSEGASKGHPRSSGRAGEEKEEEQERERVQGEPSTPQAPTAAAPEAKGDEKPKAKPKAPPKRLPRTFLPADWQPPTELAAEVRAAGLDLHAVVADFVGHWRSEGKPSADWDARFRQNIARIVRTDWLIARFAAPPSAALPPPAPFEPMGEPLTGPEAEKATAGLLAGLAALVEDQTPAMLRGLDVNGPWTTRTGTGGP